MNRPLFAPTPSLYRFPASAVRLQCRLSRLWLLLLLASAFFCLPAAAATVPNLVTKPVDTSLVTPLVQNHPAWAVAANQISQVPDDQDLEQLTLVLTRPAAQQQAFEQLLADQQNPASPSYHQWLTATEIGTRFGVSDSDLASISGWLTSQGLHVNFVSPDRAQVGFGGTAASINRAFQTSLGYYNVRGQQRLSVSSEPSIPQALSPAIKSVRGLFSIGERPMHAASQLTAASPQMTSSSGNHYITPADFATIYDVPSAYTGAGITIGIVSWSRVSTADLDAFRSKTSTSFPNPTEVIPTAYSGTDPGAAYTAPPSSSVDLGGQEEATLDVLRTGSTAPGANLLLVASQATTASNDGIGADTQYLVYKSAANIITISFGACESEAGASNVAFWDSLFSTAAGEGISVFVSSGDSAAAGCDTAFSAPPATPIANSPNYICSSKYATCVGGTQFADTASPSTYWSSSNSTGYKSVISYIPEGGWNESTTASIAGSGGGVSTVVATPSWQTGTGVPAARAGRYTPDVSFSAAAHDSYFACMASVGNSTSNAGCTGSTWYFLSFSGTSAAAPGMAGVAALLDQKLGGAQGNLNPKLYALATSSPTAFHDVTATTSGVSSCSISTPSLCNNSIYSSSAGAVQPGFLVTTGYDEVTGLGSLDVANFLNVYNASTVTPTVTVTPASSSITTAQSLSVTVAVSGTSGTPTGSVTVSSGNYTSAAATLSSGSATVTIPAGSLASGSATITAAYTPDASSSTTYSTATGMAATAVTVSKSTPTVAVTPSSTSFNIALPLSVSVTVSAGSGTATATGTVTLASGSYTSSATTLASGSATITVPAGSLAVGSDTLTVTYTPDSAGATLYNSNSGASSVTVFKATPTVALAPAYSTIVPGQSLRVSISVTAASGVADSGNLVATGSVVLSSGSYSSSATTLSSETATITIPAGTFSTGTPTLTATYTPDATSSAIYNSNSGTSSITVAKATPTVSASASPTSITTVQSTTITVSVSGAAGAGNPTPSGSVVLTSGSYTSSAATLSSGSASITIPAGTLSTGANTITATYTPDGSSSSSFNTNSGTTSVTVGTVAPTVSVSASPSSFTTLQSTAVTVTATGGTGNPTVTGSVVLTSGSYTSVATALSSGAATIAIPAGSLTAGTPTITATYTPDTAGAAVYKTTTGTASVTVTKVTPTVAVAASPANITTLQPTSVTVSLSGGSGAPTATGSVVLTSGSYTSSAVTLSSGSATIAVPAMTLLPGTDTVTATYTPDTAGTATYNSATGTTTATVTRVAPSVTVTPGSSSIAVYQSLGVTISVSGGSGALTPSGSVVLTGGGYTSSAATLSSGSATITIPANSLTAATSVALTATYTPDTTSTAVYTATAGSGAVAVTSLSGSSSSSPLTATKGSSTSTTITVTPLYGFTGAVALTASVTSSPSGAQYLPSPSFNPTSVTISGTTAQTSTLTITTTAATTGALVAPPRPGSRWYATGGAVLACLFFFILPSRRRAWRNIAGMLLLLAALAGGIAACGGGGSGSGGSTGTPGTTSGSYTITIYGNGYQISTVNLTVQ